jgi:hypothetical protein
MPRPEVIALKRLVYLLFATIVATSCSSVKKVVVKDIPLQEQEQVLDKYKDHMVWTRVTVHDMGDGGSVPRDEKVQIVDVAMHYKGSVTIQTLKRKNKIVQGLELERPLTPEKIDGRLKELFWFDDPTIRQVKFIRKYGKKTAQAIMDHQLFAGMPADAAELWLGGDAIHWDVFRDVNETAAIVYGGKRAPGKSAVLILGGGSPKNFALQTEPQIQEVLGLEEAGHDYFLQITDARVDTGGLSGATPGEAVSWGKIDPNRLPDAVVAYCDTTIALPILTAYALGKRPARPLKRLYQKREALLAEIRSAHAEARSAGAGKGPRS